jgi:hypothetical protein
MADNPTTGELYKAKVVTEADIVAAVDAFIADPTTTLFVLGAGYRLDLAGAVRSHPFANATISGGEATRTRKYSAVRTAILLARPEKG